ncbi:unnamed protein product [Eruca vesicaria subsp. sativa]|uniref:MD-2-related lipid-recognition domain-containing protein n=1 Tax=Eruca vesicaria subsp. sativa TaxID=29727 RepID=A0ABC8JM60_ERUVS|nr:unnamed protein product [Eruca vesicaria subsp. sativa]
MAISHGLQPLLLLLLLSLFFLPAALGAFVNFTNCGVSNGVRHVNVTSVDVNPYPLGLGENATFTITAVTNFNNRTAGNVLFRALSGPSALNWVQKTYSLCDVTACPVTPGPIVFNFPIFIPRSGIKVINQSEYYAEMRMYERIVYPSMCVVFRFPIRNWT